MRLTRLLAATALAAAMSFVSAPLLCAQMADSTGAQPDTTQPGTMPNGTMQGDTTQNGMMPSGTMQNGTTPMDATQGGMMQNGTNPTANPGTMGTQNDLTPSGTGTMPTGTVGGQTMPDDAGNDTSGMGATGTTNVTPTRSMGVHKEQ